MSIGLTEVFSSDSKTQVPILPEICRYMVLNNAIAKVIKSALQIKAAAPGAQFMPEATVNGIRTYYEKHGAGMPMLFIHGGAGGLLSTLAPPTGILPTIFRHDRVQVILYDRRSSGRSQYILTPYTLSDLAADVIALLSYLEIEKAVITGDSMGGPVAMTFALTYPRKTIGLGLLETGASLLAEKDLAPEGRGLHNAAITAHRAREMGDKALFESRRVQLRHPPPQIPLGPENARWGKFWQQRRELYMANLAKIDDEQLYTYFTGSTRNIEAYYGVDLTPRLPELAMPVCIIHGDSDPIVAPSYAEDLKKAIPHGQLHIIPGGSHGILLYREAQRELRKWVLSLEKGRTTPVG